MQFIGLQELMSGAQKALVTALVASLVMLSAYFIMEPMVSRAATDVFTVTQTVAAEISFATAGSDIAMSQSIPGVTGGTATGQTQVVVTTNSVSGYTMTVGFSTSTAMQGDTQGGEIQNYTPTSGIIPDYNFSVGVNTAEFAYSIAASSTADIDTTFRNNGSACNNAGGGDQLDKCWAAPSTTAGIAAAETVITTSAATPASGSTSTVKFQVQITSNPAPAVPADDYIATTTLTATVI